MHFFATYLKSGEQLWKKEFDAKETDRYNIIEVNKYDENFKKKISQLKGNKIYLLDMFSNTFHFETMVIMSKK